MAKGFWLVALLTFVVNPAVWSATHPPDSAPVAWDYRVDPLPDLSELKVDARIVAPPGSSLEVALPDYLESLELETDGSWKPLVDWQLPASSGRTRWHIRYRYRLADAARTERDPQSAGRYGGVIVSPPSSWLLHPEAYPEKQDFRFRVVCPAGMVFDSGVTRRDDGYRASAQTLEQTPASVLGSLSLTHLKVGGGQIELAWLKGALSLEDKALLNFIRNRLEGVSRYFGRFPVRRVLLVMLPTSGGHIGGVALGNGGASVVILMPSRLSSQEILHSWELTHELIHLGFPSLAPEFHWAEEGLATYLEPVIRSRSGELKPQDVWTEFLEGAQNSEPQPSSELGLDDNQDWAQTYWGGAMFWLLADVEIRKVTANRHSLQTALRAVVAQGGNITQEWALEKVLRLGDAATGNSVLKSLHAQMGPKPARPSLSHCFSLLGVQTSGDTVVFRKAPLDWIRQSITGDKL